DVREFTLLGWIRPSSLATPRAALWGQHDAIQVGFVEGRTLELWTAGGGVLDVRYPFASNEWHQVAALGTGQSLKIYFDGALVAETAETTINYGASSSPFVIGGGGLLDGAGNFYRGFIDEVSVFDRA